MYIFKIIELNHLKLCMLLLINKEKNIVLALRSPRQQISFQTSLFLKQHHFSSVENIFGSKLVEQIFTDLTNSKLKFYFGDFGQKTNIFDKET